MKILHFVLGKVNPNRANGVNQVVFGLAKSQTELGHEVKVIGISHSLNSDYEIINRGAFNVDVFKYFNKKCKQQLKRVILESDIIHLHGVWNFYNVQIGRYCEKVNKPYVITAHGGYIKQAMRKSSYLLKIGFHILFTKHLFEHALFVHALTNEESTEILEMCPQANTEVIPNGIDLEQYSGLKYQVKNRNKITIGYLGRISKEKNLHNLIKAIALIPNKDKKILTLNIIGPVNQEDSYYKNLCKLINSYKLDDNIKFIGPKYGIDKINSLLELDIYIQPSLIEGFSISLLEVLALGIPSIITRTSNVAYYYNSNSFIMTEPTSNSIAKSISGIIYRKNEWETLSSNAHKLVHNQLTWISVTKKICSTYERYISEIKKGSIKNSIGF